MKRKILLLICLILFIVSIAGVSASEDTNQTIIYDTLSVSQSDGEILESADGGTFTDLQKKIDDADEGSIITLENDYTYDSGFSKKGVIINKNLTINGNGYVIDALGQSRIFYITSPTLILNNMTLKNGNDHFDGGAIYFDSGVSDCSVSGTFINNSASYGSAIYFARGISDCSVSGTFINNSASYGGAIYFKSVSNSSISGVFINNYAHSSGGAIYFKSVSNSSISGVFIDNCADSWYGGAIYIDNSISDCNVSGEFFNNSLRAIFIEGSASNCCISGEFFNNYGEAIYFRELISNSSISGVFINNSRRGAISINGGASNCSVSGEFINNTGQAIFFGGMVSDSSVSGVFINNSARNYGGAIYFGEDVINCNVSGEFVNNSGYYGGAINIARTASNSRVFGEFVDNYAIYEGGTIYLNRLLNSSVFGEFVNSFASMDGGTLSIGYDSSNFSVFGEFVNSSSSQNGGTVYIGGGSFNFSISGEFVNSSAVDGGVIYIGYYASNCSISGEFVNSSAANDGGAIFFDVDVSNSTISGEFVNNSAVNGGAVFVEYEASNCSISGEFINNTANSTGPIAIYSVVDCTILDRFISSYGYYGYFDDGTFTELQKKIKNAPEESLIILANDYAYDSGFSTEGIKINKAITIEGNGHVIDALSQSRIFNINSPTVNLNNLSLKNAYAPYGGAILFGVSVSDSNISCDFINNYAVNDGGAIYIDGDASNCNINGEFINNIADGAAGTIFIVQKVSNCNLLDNFILNSFSYHAPRTFYVDNSASADGDGSISSPYNNLKSAIDYANSGDIICFAPGTYVGEDNVGLTIDKSLTLASSGDGDVIFDARNNGRIFTINANSFNIGGLTFTRATDSAIVFNNGLVYSVIEADFRDNEKTSGKGGAIYVRGNISDSIFIGNFSNNSVNGSGGAIYADNISGSTFNCDFGNNGACDEGGVIYANISGSTFNGDFTDNAALIGGVIYGNVSDSIFNGDFTRNNGGVIYGNVSGSIFNGDFTRNNAGDGTFLKSGLLGFAPIFGGMPASGGVINGNVINSAFNSNFIENTADIGGVINGNVGKSFFTGDISNNVADTCAVVNGKLDNVIFCGQISQDIIDFAGGKASDWVNSYIKETYVGEDVGRIEGNDSGESRDVELDINLYVNSMFDKKGFGTLNHPFNNLRDAVSAANILWEYKTFYGGLLFKVKIKDITIRYVVGDISIHVASGIYRGEKNIGLTIVSNGLTITNDDLGSVILDAENNGTIFTVMHPELNINGLTFMHASNSAIVFEEYGISNSIINANFIDNYKIYSGNGDHSGGAAILSKGDIKRSIIGGIFSNNCMNTGNGGAIYVKGIVENCTFDGEFINNSLGRGPGGVMCCRDIINTVFSGSYIQNTAKNYEGGVILADNVINSTFSGIFRDNLGYGGSSAGVLYADNIVDSIFSGYFRNNTGTAAGGVISSSGNVSNSIFNGVFMDNSAIYASSSGGGVLYCKNIFNSTFSGIFVNNSDIGGGDYGDGGVITCKSIAESIITGYFINNSATARGGAIYSENIVDSIFNGTFNGNFVDNDYDYECRYGGAIYGATINRCNFYGDYINNKAIYGGAVFVQNIDYCTFNAHYSGNTATYGNVLWTFWFYSHGDVTLHNTANIPDGDLCESNRPKSGNMLSCSKPEDDLLESSLNVIYVDGFALINGDGSPDNPFNNLNSAISQVNENGTIYIAPGTYTGENNVGLLIPQSLNLVNWGDGDVIFDAENNGTIFISYTRYLNITGLTFIRATDSALIFLNGLDGSRIEANFRDNKKADGEGGALYFMGYVSDSTFSGDYVNNGASTYGGAICANSIISCSFDCDFINNTADIDGGAIDAMIMDSTFNCDFINNTAAGDGGAIDGNIYKSSFTGDFTNNNAVNGGVVFGSASSSNFTGNFTNNGAVNGGVISGSVSSSNFACNFVDNGANENGGVICGAVSSSNFQGNFINNNAANGGVVYSKGDVSKSIFKGVFTNDTSESGFGGVVYVTGGISSSVFTGNVFVSNPLYPVVYSARGMIVKCIFNDFNVIITAPDVSVAYNDPSGELVATIVNGQGNPLVVNLNFNFNGKDYVVKTDSDGQASIAIGTLSPGKYVATISYAESGNHEVSSTTALVTVTKADTVISVQDVSLAYKYPNGELVATIVNEHGKPLVVNLNVELNGNTYAVKTDSKGEASIPVGTLSPGKYTAKISYKGSGNYKASSTSAKVTVTKAGTVISVQDVSLAYKDPNGELVATIVNEHGKPLAVNLNVELNGKTSTVRTDSNGQASILIGTLSPGKYNVTISYKGSVNYKASSTSALVTVTKSGTVISAQDVSVAYKDPSGELVVTIVNEHGKPLAVNLNVELNGKTSTVRTDSNGQASIPIGTLSPGTYNATISYKGSVNYKASSTTALVTVTKADTIISAQDVSVAYKDPNGELVVTIVNEHGKALVVNLNVELNGKTYAVRTDSDGQASIPIGTLSPGKYTATISYKGSGNYKASSATAQVTVTKADTIISAPDISFAYKDPNSAVVATIVNEHGKPLVVTLNVELNGKTYTAKTDSEGKASIPIGTLSPGTYNATISYKGSGNYKASSTTAQVTVTKADTIISAPDVSVAYGDPNGELVATIVNEHGKPLVVNMNVDLNGKTYKVKSDSNGQISVSTADLAPGTYSATISYKGSSNYNSSSTTANIQVKQ